MGRPRPWILIPTAALLVGQMACGLLSNDPAAPCHGVATGDRIVMTVGERRRPSPELPSNTTCNDVLGDLPMGATLEATLTGFEAGSSGADGCLSGRATFAPLGSWTWQPASPPGRPAGSHTVEGRYEAVRGACTGIVGVKLQGPVPGTATLSRAFERKAGDDRCPEFCSGEFTVTTSKK